MRQGHASLNIGVNKHPLIQYLLGKSAIQKVSVGDKKTEALILYDMCSSQWTEKEWHNEEFNSC